MKMYIFAIVLNKNDVVMDTNEIKNEVKEQPRYNKSWEAALKHKGNMTVNDISLYYN